MAITPWNHFFEKIVAEREKLLQSKVLDLSNRFQRILKNLQFFLEFSLVKGSNYVRLPFVIFADDGSQ
jgi:hypothetical protein